MKRKKRSLTTIILFSLFGGILCGLGINLFDTSGFLDQTFLQYALRPIGQMFIEALKMLVVPIVFISIVSGAASLGDIKRVGIIGGRTILFYLFTTAVAISIALCVGIWIAPGRGVDFNMSEQISGQLMEKKNIDMVFTSDCVRNIGTVKYFLKEDGQININDSFNEINWKRKDNEIEKKILRDFDFKEYGCESVNDVRKRMAEALKTILFHYQDDRILIASHKIAIISLLSIWCEIGYNYENDLIMSYEDQTIIDGVWEDLVIFKLEFEGKDLINLKRLYL